jgi:hypothetical protein
MARGWESKSVESQMDSAKEEQPENSKGQLTAEQRQAQRERQGLIMTRSRVVQQIESSSNEVYIRSLRQALTELDEKIAKIKV